MKTKSIFLLVFLTLFSFLSDAQIVVKDTLNVNEPRNGKLYYQRSDKTMYLFEGNKFKKFSTSTTEPPVVPPIKPETEVGSWNVVQGSVLVTKQTNSTLWLLQTTANRDYYVIRGSNFLGRGDVKITTPVDVTKLSNEITAQGGLYPASSGSLPVKWDSAWWAENGYERNQAGEFVKKK